MSPPAANLAERDALLATKLHAPRPRPGFVLRPRLLEHLQEGMGQQVVLVCTPAGFGKTSLLADWARRDRRPVAWLSLDEGDNDPARFWRHVVAALEGVRPGVAERVTPLPGPPVPSSFEGLGTAVINRLGDHPRPAGGGGGGPARAPPPLQLARLRASGQLAELREADLRFTPEEAAELLREAVGPGVALPDTVVAALAARTEGWAAGLQLAGLSLRGRAEVPALGGGFSGSHRYVLDYLAEEGLDRQPPPLREFLLETSVLERLSGRLCQRVTGRAGGPALRGSLRKSWRRERVWGPRCDAASGRAGGQRLLEQVERANLFLVPLDEVRGWWRFHQLFADLLRARLQQEQPERVPELHRAAATWLENHGQADEAVDHALATGDAAWAAALVDRHAQTLLQRGEGATLARWLAAPPPPLVRSPPPLWLLGGPRAVTDGQP